jgi:hypothetical protein
VKFVEEQVEGNPLLHIPLNIIFAKRAPIAGQT